LFGIEIIAFTETFKMAKFSSAALVLAIVASQGTAFSPPRQSLPVTQLQQSSQVAPAEIEERTQTSMPSIPRASDMPPPLPVTVGQEPQELTPESPSLTTPKREKILKEPALWEYNFGLQSPSITLPHNIESRVTAPEKYQLTQDQIATLERDGVLHVKSVFDAEWVEYLRAATNDQVANPHFWAFAGTASKLYDYIQRNIWQTNRAFADFYYHSALGHVLAQCGRTEEVRISTDLLMVNPNKGFKWHQDNQNGPITWEDGIRFWITMDETPADYGAPVYLKGSHRNTVVPEESVFVDIEMEGLEEYKDKMLEFRTMPGDMLIWHPKTIHKVDGPSDGIWTTYRRVLGGTAAKAGTIYTDKRGTGGVLSDLGRHGLEGGDKLSSPFFPIVYPQFDKDEARSRDNGEVGRNFQDIVQKIGG
jgi:hypothetical protein